MRIAEHLKRGLGAVALAVLAPWAGAAGDALATARDLAKASKWTEVVSVLEEHLRFSQSTPPIDDLLGQALMQLGRRDEAAHYYERAYVAWPEGDKEAPKLRKRLIEADPLFARRESLFKKASKDLLESAKELEAGDQKVRALELLDRVRPLARGADLQSVDALAKKIRSSTQQVDLDVAGGERPAEGWPEVKIESERYKLHAHLEPSVAALLGKTMDEIFKYYMKIYFDDNAAYLDPRKATIVIHPSREDLLKGWTQEGTPEGWWSPMDWEVHAYDTRSSSGSLDSMLETLFHEASHQFMTMLSRGGPTPAWINEGTSSFFEGASAMADGTVLWPDAAKGRLSNLYMMLTIKNSGDGRFPTFLDVISYDKPGSYPGEYYPWGWGLVYYLQQYEDPSTLAYVYRPLYITYRDEVVRKGGNPREVFARVLVGANTPRGHQTLEDFERDWRSWVLQTIYPLHFASNRRELRLAEVQRYMDAAKLAAADKTAKIGEKELLLRALGHLDYVVKHVDDPDEPDAAILLAQADLFERVGQAATAAPILEQLLALADDGTWAASEAELEALGKRLAKLDKKNAALTTARSRTRALARSARSLVEEYRGGKVVLPLRAYTLASLAATAFDDPKGLGTAAAELRETAREAGLLKGTTLKLAGAAGTWTTIFTNLEAQFEATPERVIIEGSRPVGRLCTALTLRGEYEVRARLTRQGEGKVGSLHGLVVAGTPEGDWAVVGVDHEGKLTLKRLTYNGSGVSETNVFSVNLKAPPPIGEPFDFVAHVFSDGSLEVTVGKEGPFPFRLPIVQPEKAHVGVYVKNGALVVEGAVVEIVP